MYSRIYMHIYTYIYTSSWPSYRAISADIPDPLSLPLPIVHCFQQVFRVTSSIGTELLYVGSGWSSSLCSSMWSGVHRCTSVMSSSLLLQHSTEGLARLDRNLDSFRDGWLVAVQLLLGRVLPLGLVQYCSQHYCVVAVKLFLQPFS